MSLSSSSSLKDENTYEQLLEHIKEFLIINKVKRRVVDLITDENDHIKLYRYLLFDFSESVSAMVKRYIMFINVGVQEDGIQETINEYRFGRGEDYKDVDDCNIRTLVFKIGSSEYNITSKIDETEFIECFINTQDLINFTIRFISKTVKYHNLSSFCDSVDSNSSSFKTIS
ncbi:hypothetical protein DICPUDRAFT_147673 [Dictyostelium purpureum]|uniref:Uncharacterized protein n=1 Tax=Dictyostelium purpureum TaxID=5786 RepID=F0Z939_DICPU|nr:uncharacterized protein DICPUDRAFT_147673 [Dictyostelium purpureum]EGC39486.1 hypothetical protein DICPUDRAFT_147673 [Dictyostelium purpureum]|eukprot:XP_003283933.1 hypothetical protein DICPUDRAFT_147673 [Dictyostelium purpureum]